MPTYRRAFQPWHRGNISQRQSWQVVSNCACSDGSSILYVLFVASGCAAHQHALCSACLLLKRKGKNVKDVCACGSGNAANFEGVVEQRVQS